MKLTPIDIEQQKFRVKWRGYEAREVHHFLEMVAQQIAELNREAADLRGDLSRRQHELEAVQKREEGLKATMIMAQKAIDDLRETAQREAQLVLNEAELRADKILHAAHSQATEIQQEVASLRRQRVRFIEEVRGVVNTHARLLDVHSADLRDPTEAINVSLLDRLRPPSPPAADDAHHELL